MRCGVKGSLREPLSGFVLFENSFYGNVEKSRQPSLKLRLTSQRFHACRAYFAEVSYEG